VLDPETTSLATGPGRPEPAYLSVVIPAYEERGRIGPTLDRMRQNRGKGRAARVGMSAATGQWRAFLDADGSTDPAELSKLLAPAAPVLTPGCSSCRTRRGWSRAGR